jgi:thiosulfate dehydrogenase
MPSMRISAIVAIFAAWLLAPRVHAADAPAPAPAPVPLNPPAVSAMPGGPLGDAIRRGERIVTDTQAAAKSYVGNSLTCANCHIDAGRTAYAAPLAGLTGLFPEYRARRGSVESLEQRINDCFLRSMNGRPLPPASPEMVALLAYIAWLSQGVPTGVEVVGRGFKEIAAPAKLDAARGKALYATQCAACHGAAGQGTPGAPNTFVFPPLWGPKSFNSGAGMARVSIAAAFVQVKMPLGNAGTLTDQDAFDIAAYFTAQPRPAFAGTSKDWPNARKPADAR